MKHYSFFFCLIINFKTDERARRGIRYPVLPNTILIIYILLYIVLGWFILEVVLKQQMGYMSAAKSFSVPLTTLKRKVKKARENESTMENIKIPLGTIILAKGT